MKPFVTIFSLLAVLQLTNCKKDAPLLQSPPPSGNLISNYSFETGNGSSSFSGWTGSGYSFSNDVPQGGGTWSLEIEPEWSSEGFAETYVTGISGTHTFTLSCETKTPNWRGQIILRKENSAGIDTTLLSTYFMNSSWANTILTVTATLLPTDKLIVHLSAGFTEVALGQVYFDNVYLTSH